MSWFQRRGLRVLMYHKISPETGDALTVSTAQLEEQLKWLIEEEFEFVTGSHVVASLENGAALSPRSVLVTFDDAYLNNHELAFPLLAKHRIPSVLFVPTAFIGQESSWDLAAHPLMNVEQLRVAVASGVELALHSHHHVNYGSLTPKLLAADVQACVNTFGELGLPYIPALAYPFGRRPKKKADYLAMLSSFERAGVKAAFRIGNRVNPLPLRERFEIQRIGVCGDESLADFQRKIKRGRWF